jgi:hypothetical protein
MAYHIRGDKILTDSEVSKHDSRNDLDIDFLWPELDTLHSILRWVCLPSWVFIPFWCAISMMEWYGKFSFYFMCLSIVTGATVAYLIANVRWFQYAALAAQLAGVVWVALHGKEL